MGKASLTLFMQSNNFILHFSFDNLLISKKNCVTVEHKLRFPQRFHMHSMTLKMQICEEFKVLFRAIRICFIACQKVRAHKVQLRVFVCVGECLTWPYLLTPIVSTA